MSFIKVLGIGSPFGEDQAGWKVAEILKHFMLMHPYAHQYVKLESFDRPGVRLIELMHDANIVFLIDAVKANNELGTIHRLQNNEIQEFKILLSTHHMGIAQALQLGGALNDLPDNIIFYGIEINNTELYSTVSESLAFAINQVAVLVFDEIINILAKIKMADTN